MAMKLGSHYRVREIRRRDWETLARELRLSPAEMLDRIKGMAERIPRVAQTVAEALTKEGVQHPVISRIVERLERHTRECISALDSGE